MYKKLLSITLFISSLSGNTQYKTISVGAFNNIDNAIRLKNNSLDFNLQIDLSKKPYIVHTGKFTKREDALLLLKKLKKYYPDAYILTIYNKKNIDKEIKSITKENKENFYQEALDYYYSNRYEDALMAFDRELILNPSNQDAKLGYAKTLFKLKMYKDSKEKFLKLLQSDIKNQQKEEIKKLLLQIDKNLTSNHFYANITLSTTYDDNLNYATHKTDTLYGGVLFDNNTTKIKGTYQNINLNLSHLYKSDYYRWSNTLYLYNEIQNKKNIDDLNYLYLSSALSKDINNITLSTNIGISYLILDHRSEYQTIFISPYLSYMLSKHSKIGWKLKYEKLNNKRDKNRDYDKFETTLSYATIFKKFSFNSYILFSYDKEIHKLRYDIDRYNKTIFANLNYPLSKNIKLDTGIKLQQYNYNDLDPAIGYKREDKFSRYFAILNYLLNSHTSAYLQYTTLYNSSNIDTYSYKKDSYSFGVNLKF